MSPPMPSETPRERRLTVDEFLAARVVLPTGAGGVSLEDMERAIADCRVVVHGLAAGLDTAGAVVRLGDGRALPPEPGASSARRRHGQG